MHLIRYSLCLALAGCSDFPDLAGAEGPGVADATYPRLLTAQELRAIPASSETLTVEASLLARIRALEARAARLGGPVVDRATRARMARGVR